MNATDLKKYFAYLDELYENKDPGTDATVMFTAPGYLASFWGLTVQEAMEVCFSWMKTYGRGHTLDERVASVLRSKA